MLKDLRSKARDLSSAAARDRRQLSKARVIDSEKVAHLRDKREKVDSEKVDRPAAREEKKRQELQKTSSQNQVREEGN